MRTKLPGRRAPANARGRSESSRSKRRDDDYPGGLAVHSGPLTPARIMHLQRTAGNQAVCQLLGVARSPVAVQRAPGGKGSASAMLDDYDDYDDYDDFDDDADEDIDDEAKEYLASNKRPSPTIWDLAPKQLHDEVALQERREARRIRQKERRAKRAELKRSELGHMGSEKGEAEFNRVALKGRRQELRGLSGSVAAGKGALAEQQRQREEERRRVEEERKRLEEEAKKLVAEKLEKERLQKDEIERAIRDELTPTKWAKVPGTKRTELVQGAWESSLVSPQQIESWVRNRMKAKSGNSEKKRRLAEAEVPNYLKGMLDGAIKVAVTLAEGIANKVIQQENAADLLLDKQLLRDGLTARGASGDAKELLYRAIDLIELSTGTDASVDKGYSLATIGTACEHWGRLGGTTVSGQTVNSQLRIMDNLRSPGDWYEIYWKDRGNAYERTKNLMATVGKHTINIHIHPGRWRWEKKKGSPPLGD